MDLDPKRQDLSENDLFEENTDENFYRPLSVTGYLTPLQRKKLREKRGLSTHFCIESDTLKKDVKPRLMKRKKEVKVSIPAKREKKTKFKEHIPQIHCSAAQVICKTKNNFREKKFFKSSSSNRLERANFSMPFVFKKNVFSAIDKNIKENILPPKKRSSSMDCSFDIETSEKNNGENDRINVSPCIIKIGSFRDKDEDSLQKELTVETTEHVETLFDFDWPSDEMLLKRQEEARALIKQQKLLNEPVDNKEELHNNEEPAQKLYPIFYFSSKKDSKCQQESKRKQKNVTKRSKETSNGVEQMLIDAGQKEFGAKICSTCNMIYSVGVEEDERLHFEYHNTYLINLKFPGWKEENVIGEYVDGDYVDGRIIMIRRNESSFKIKKVEDVLEIANRDLGFPTSSLPPKPDLTFLLYISNTKQVVGCLVAEPISQASHVLLAEDSESAGEKEVSWRIGNWYASSETVPAVCGVNRIWVAHNYRRKKVASRMIECLRHNFVHGHVINIEELAFTDPSPDGREFAASYTKTDHFLVYK